jgi:hypothetical protein
VDRDVWDLALDELETRVRAQATFLAGDGPCPEGQWTPPPGALPAELRERVLVLLAQSRDVERELTARSRRSAPAPLSPYR